MDFVKIKILKRNPGKFNLSAKVGQVVKFEAKQAAELVNAGYAEYVKKTTKETNPIKNIKSILGIKN